MKLTPKHDSICFDKKDFMKFLDHFLQKLSVIMVITPNEQNVEARVITPKEGMGHLHIVMNRNKQ